MSRHTRGCSHAPGVSSGLTSSSIPPSNTFRAVDYVSQTNCRSTRLRHPSSHRRGHVSSTSPGDSDIISPVPTTSSITNITDSDPPIHELFLWRPDQRNPRLHWDLSRPFYPLCNGRYLTPEQLATSAFTPPLLSIGIILGPHADWKFYLSVGTGEPFTVAHLIRSIMELIRTPDKVPHVHWARASPEQKEAIVKAKLKRTGCSSRTWSADVPRLQALEEEILDGARNGSTSLLVSDFLGKEVMFAGLELYKEPDEWLLHTIRRH